MVDKLKEAALILKAKITKDEVEELLLEATSQDNWQTPTTVLHALADAAFNYDQWQKISSFIWQKLKSKRWKKIIKTLNLIEFLLKNGPPSILSTFKYEVYQFRSFDGFNCYDEGVDRGEASMIQFNEVREKAKSIVELLTNEQLLEEERVKAKTIRQRLAGTSSQSAYSGMGSSSSGSKYGGTNYKNDGSKYAGYGSNSKGGVPSSSSAPYSSGAYDQGKSTLDKYKNISGGGLYSKQNLKKEKKDEKQTAEPQKKEQEIVAPKPFASEARTLKKPGEVRPTPPPPAQNTSINKPPQNTTTVTPTPVQPAQTQQAAGGFDFFSFDEPAAPTQPTTQPVAPSIQHVQQPPQPTVQPQPQPSYTPQQPVQQPQFTQVAQVPLTQQTHPLVNPMYSTTAQMASLNLTQQVPAAQQGYGLNGGYPAHVNPMYPTTAPLAYPQQTQQPAVGYQQQAGGFAHVNPMYPTTAPLAAGYTPQLPQHMPSVASHYPQQPVAQQPAPVQPKPVVGYSMSTGPSKPIQPKDEDEFGGFESSNKNETKWLSKDENNLIDLNDLGNEMKEKKKDDGSRKAQQPKKKQSNEGGLLATAEDFQSFMSGPSVQPQSYNISMNINNVNFGMPSMPTQSRPVVDPLLHMGNVMGGMQYPTGYNQGYPQMTPQQYQQYMQQQQQQQQFGYRH